MNPNYPVHLRLNTHINTIVGNTLAPVHQRPMIGLRQLDLIEEELRELLDKGFGAKNAKEIRDGLGDVIVTTDGLFSRLGAEYPTVTDLASPAYLPMTEEELVADVESLMDDVEFIRHALLAAVSWNEELDDVVRRHGGAILWTMYSLAHNLDIDLHADQLAIYNSNLSKFDPTLALAAETVSKYAALHVPTGIFPYSEITADGQGMADVHYHVVRATANARGLDGKNYNEGKFLKSVNFVEPQFEPLADDARLVQLFPVLPASETGLVNA